LLFQQIQHLFQTLSNPQDMNFEMTKTQYLVPSDKQPVLTMNTESFGGKRSWSIFSGSGLVLYIDIIVYNCHMAKGQST
jgi:glutamate dehydrogenase/leucine dehydrogenase